MMARTLVVRPSDVYMLMCACHSSMCTYVLYLCMHMYTDMCVCPTHLVLCACVNLYERFQNILAGHL